jgi:hypothetical protein
MPGAQSASACGAFHTEVLQFTEREDISNPEAPAFRSLTSEFGLPVAGASPRRKNQSEPTSTSPEKSGRTGTSPEQTGVEDTQLARGMSYGPHRDDLVRFRGRPICEIMHQVSKSAEWNVCLTHRVHLHESCTKIAETLGNVAATAANLQRYLRQACERDGFSPG